MKFTSNFLSTLFLVLLTSSNESLIGVSAHGAMESLQEIAARGEHIAASKRALDKCAEKLQTPERIAQRLERRTALVERFVKEKMDAGVKINLNPKLRRRDLSDQVKVPDLFPAKPECLLAPELTIGPYYAPNQLIRSDMREDIPGVEMLIAMELIDVNTCETVPNAMVDFWHCSNNGVYSAFESEGTTGETFNRGLQPTGKDGIVTMTSIIPGWYTGRATHIHIATHLNGTISSNGDYYSGGTHSHIGQLFLPEKLLEQVKSNSLYAENNNERMLNSEDSIYKQHAESGLNPEMAIHYIDEDDIGKGIVGTMVLGIDTSKNYTLTMGGGPGGNGTGNGGPGGPGGPGGTNTTSTGSGTGTETPVAVTSTSGARVVGIRRLIGVQGLTVAMLPLFAAFGLVL